MLAVPPALLELLHLEAGSVVGIDIEDQNLVVRPQRKSRYTLDQLLSERQQHPKERSPEDQTWIDLPPAGQEL
jgi:antitoxin ChpS